jgi:hypothetical protein
MSIDDLFGKAREKTVQHPVVIDFSNILHSSFHTSSVRFDKSLKSSHEKYAMWRYILLNQIANIKTTLNPDELTLAIDSNSWRKKDFEFYKANRAIARAKQTDFNYEEFIEVANGFVQEIKENFPYKVIQVPNAEADDVIAILVNNWAEKNISHVIVSRDKDFKQLLKYNTCKFYDPVDKKFKEETDPFGFLLDHILIGDASDGIPNMLSDDNTFVDSSKRQSRITKRVREEVNELGIEEYAIRNGLIANYERNKKMIDLSIDNLPKDVVTDTMYQYNAPCPESNFMKVSSFMRKYKIRSLVANVDKFL